MWRNFEAGIGARQDGSRGGLSLRPAAAGLLRRAVRSARAPRAVLIEATVKDAAGHAETRGEPITVSESPLIITAVPEGGTLIPNLENQVFVITSYPDGTPAAADREGARRWQSRSDRCHRRWRRGRGSRCAPALDRERSRSKPATRRETTRPAQCAWKLRDGADQILLRTEHAVYRAGDRIALRVFSTKKRGTAYVDVVKEGQTVLTRDVDMVNGQAELALTATPDLAGTVDLHAYLFGRRCPARRRSSAGLRAACRRAEDRSHGGRGRVQTRRRGAHALPRDQRARRRRAGRAGRAGGG